MIKLAVAEDNGFLATAITEKISFFNDLKLKFIASSGTDMINRLEDDHNIDLILMDIEMPEMNGIEATEIIKNKYPHIKILMLTVYDDDDSVFNSIKSGADGYLLKETNAEILKRSILDVMNGGAAMSPNIALKTLKLLRNPNAMEEQNQQEEFQLSKRETEILEQLSKGLNYHQIADNLIISPSTVRKHIENIYKKLHVHNKMEAVQKAIKHNIL